MPNFGEKLKQLRNYNGYTQEDLASMVKSSKQVISRYEKGYRSPDITIAKNWANALNIPVRYLVDDSLDLIEFLKNPNNSKNNLIPLEKIKKIPCTWKNCMWYSYFSRTKYRWIYFTPKWNFCRLCP